MLAGASSLVSPRSLRQAMNVGTNAAATPSCVAIACAFSASRHSAGKRYCRSAGRCGSWRPACKKERLCTEKRRSVFEGSCVLQKRVALLKSLAIRLCKHQTSPIRLQPLQFAREHGLHRVHSSSFALAHLFSRPVNAAEARKREALGPNDLGICLRQGSSVERVKDYFRAPNVSGDRTCREANPHGSINRRPEHSRVRTVTENDGGAGYWVGVAITDLRWILSV